MSEKRILPANAVWAAVCAAILAGASPAAADPFGGFMRGVGEGFGAALGGMMMGGQRQRGYGYGYQRQRRSNSNGSGASSGSGGGVSAAESKRQLAALGAPPPAEQDVVFKAIYASPTLGAVGSFDDPSKRGFTSSKEEDRDYTKKVESIIAKLNDQQRKQSSTTQGDITRKGILDGLGEAIRMAKLDRFETFLGEDWSPEHLRVMILERVDNNLSGLFDGTNRGAVSMSELDGMIKSAAREVHAHLTEASELLAANHSAMLFVERLYETHGDLIKDNEREDAEPLLTRAAAEAVAPLEGLLRRDPDSFALRYRARRIVFDCLSENVEAISVSDSTLASRDEIEQRMSDVNKQQCAKWTAAQLIGPDGRLKPQDPMPLRVIWSGDGARDDPSMYGHAVDQI